MHKSPLASKNWSLSRAAIARYVAAQEIGNGIWNVY